MELKKMNELPAWTMAAWNEDMSQCVNKIKAVEAGVALWSGTMDPPKVGDVIRIKINNIGQAEVVGYGVADCWLGVMAKPMNPPAWYVKQNGGNIASIVYGAEIGS